LSFSYQKYWFGIRKKPISDPVSGVKKAPDPGSATLSKTFPLSVIDMGGFSCSHEELQYARKVVSYNETVASGGAKPDLLPSFASLFPEDTRQVGISLTRPQGFGSGSAWIRINLSCWIRIQEGKNDPQK
jgi:hypothetical protein